MSGNIDLLVILREIICSFLNFFFDVFWNGLYLTFNFHKNIWLIIKCFLLKESLTLLLFHRSLILSQSLLLRIELPKYIPSILVEDWDRIILPNLSVLFPYPVARNAKFVFLPFFFYQPLKIRLASFRPIKIGIKKGFPEKMQN